MDDQLVDKGDAVVHASRDRLSWSVWTTGAKWGLSRVTPLDTTDYPAVRGALEQLQKRCKHNSWEKQIAEGRDRGENPVTVVVPADPKKEKDEIRFRVKFVDDIGDSPAGTKARSSVA